MSIQQKGSELSTTAGTSNRNVRHKSNLINTAGPKFESRTRRIGFRDRGPKPLRNGVALIEPLKASRICRGPVKASSPRRSRKRPPGGSQKWKRIPYAGPPHPPWAPLAHPAHLPGIPTNWGSSGSKGLIWGKMDREPPPRLGDPATATLAEGDTHCFASNGGFAN